MSPLAVLTLRRRTNGDIRTSPPSLVVFPLSRMDGITPPLLLPPPAFVPHYGDARPLRLRDAHHPLRSAILGPCFGGILAADARLSASVVQTSIASVIWGWYATSHGLSERGCAIHGFADIPRASMPYLLGGSSFGGSGVVCFGHVSW